MPLLSTLGAASAQSFKGRGGPDLLLTAAGSDIVALSSGQFSVPPDADIQSGDLLIVAQGSGDSNVTTIPNPVADGYYAPSGTGFLRLSANFTNYGSSGDSPQICASCGSCQKLAVGTEPDTTISGFLPTGQDGYERSDGQLIRLRPNFDIGIRAYKDNANAVGLGGTGVLTTPSLQLGVVPSTRCQLMVTVMMNHNVDNSNNLAFSKNIDAFAVFESFSSLPDSQFAVSGFYEVRMHVFPNGTNVGDITISHTNTSPGYRLINSVVYEIGTS